MADLETFAHDTARGMPPPKSRAGGLSWEELLSRARVARDYPTLQALCRRAEKLEREEGFPAGHAPLRVALLAGGAPQMLAGPLKLGLLASGFAPILHVAPYDSIVPELISAESGSSQFAPDVAIVVNTAKEIATWPELGASPERAQELANQVCDELLESARAFHERCGAEIVLNNFPPVSARPHGNLGAKLAGDRNNFVRRLNVALGDRAPSYVHVNDFAGLVERHGLERCLDLVYWYHAKQPIGFEVLAEYTRGIAAIVSACRGRSRKCLVLDLDNTLWGGVVADEGVGAIAIGEGSASGEAFKAFQTYLKSLQSRGVLLAVCSKNDERIAREPFERHPEMVLRLEDFVAFEANWLPKSQNIEAIAASLGISLDAVVFVDDNPAEREEVRQALAGVAVPELPVEPAHFPRALDSHHYFEATSISSEDLARTKAYAQRRAAEQARVSSRDLSTYLDSLQMRALVRPFEPVSFQRIVQLTNKTNQFNLTTRRVTLAEIENMAQDSRYVTRTIQLADRFGDHGLISVLFARGVGEDLCIEGWLMSCRVLQRGVEVLMVNELIRVASEAGWKRLVGVYRESARNAMVAELYPTLGFERIERKSEPPREPPREPAEERFVLPISSYMPRAVPIEVLERGA